MTLLKQEEEVGMSTPTDTREMQFRATIDDMKGRLKESWGVLTDDDVERADGRWDQLIATIRRKTGDSAETVISKINEMIDSVSDLGRPERKA